MPIAMPMTKNWVATFVASIMTFAFSMTPASADLWPQRTVRFIVPLNAGSGPDVAARLFADRLAERWKQPVVIENRPGADGLIGTAAFANVSDDHVLLYWNSAAITLYPLLQEKLSYDPRSDIVPISVTTESPFVVSVSNRLKMSSLRALFDLARSQPGKLNYNAGAGELPYLFGGFLKQASIDMVLVPYRETTLAVQDLAEGRLDVFASLLSGAVLPLAQAGKIQILAVVDKQRTRIAPQVPTAIEAGFPELAFEGLAGVFGRRDMPADRRNRVAADIRVVAADPLFADRLAAIGQIARGSTPAEFTVAIEERRTKTAEMVRLLGNTPAR